MKTEPLLDCPKCGTTGFTPRGLKAHVCKGKARNAPLAVAVVETPSLPRGSDATLAVNCLSEDSLAEAIHADIERFERTSREAAFSALRIGLGLIFVRDNGPRGALMAFIRKYFSKAHGERTLMRYIVIAEQFAKDAGLLERKTQKLTNGEAISPIMSTQLELFADPKAKFEGAMKKLVKWVGHRGLSDLYKHETKLNATKSSKLPQHTDEAPRIKTVQDLHAEAEDELTSVLNALDAWFLAEHHTRVKAATRTQAEAILEGAIAKMRAVK